MKRDEEILATNPFYRPAYLLLAAGFLVISWLSFGSTAKMVRTRAITRDENHISDDFNLKFHPTVAPGNNSHPPIDEYERHRTEKPQHHRNHPYSLFFDWWSRGASRTATKKASDYPQVCFVHVGKTAGVTLACLMGFDYYCGEDSFMDGALLPEVTNHLMHNSVNDCSTISNSTQQLLYMFSVRDPVSRMMSWFTYERPLTPKWEWACYNYAKKLFLDCPFHTINELAERGLSHGDTNVTRTCKKRAWQAITGEVGFCKHNYYNYQYFLRQTPPNATLMVIRTEHLVDDWNSVEAYLSAHKISGDKTEKPFVADERHFKDSNKSDKTEADKYLSEEARALLCSALCREIQTYKEILSRAVNLRPEDLAVSLQELNVSCPKEAQKNECR